MDPRVANEVSITDLFDQFIEASTMRNVLSIHHRILNYSDLNPCQFNIFFPKLKRAVMTNRVRKNWKAKALFSKIDKKATHRCYSNTKTPTPVGNTTCDNRNDSFQNSQECLDDSSVSQSNRAFHNNNALQNYNCLVIGSGPAGLRTAIELQLLGASQVVVVEKRSRFSRNNVLHLWPFVIDDLKSLGAKKFYGKFCAGSIDHISIRQLQLILLKICLMVGCDFRDSCSYLYLCPSSVKQSQQVEKGNNSDIQQANDRDSKELVTSICDLDDAQSPELDSFVKYSQSETAETLATSKDADPDKVDRSELDNGVEAPQGGQIDVHDCAGESIEKSTKTDNPNFNKLDSLVTQVGNSLLNDIQDPKNRATRAESNRRKRGEDLRGAHAHFKSDYQLQEKELHSYEWDVIVGADGRRNTLSKFFPRKEFRGRLAIAITANFINRQTPAEASVSEISGLSFIYNQDMFNALAFDTNIQLENICYYKDDTHYFVMTAKKKSLLERGVLISDYATTQDLLSDANVNKEALLKYAKDAAYWTTGLEPLDFALNHYGQEDCAMFDFTSMYAASNACKALRTRGGGLTLVSLVGDSLLEPFWPTGSGCARGFLSSFDAAWMCRQWAVNKCAVIDYHNSVSSRSSRNRSLTDCEENKGAVEPTTYNRMALSVMAERESIYRILAQTTSENLQQNYSHWTLNPHTRYPNLNRHLVTPSQVEHLITDNELRTSSNGTDKNKLTLPSQRGWRVKSPSQEKQRKSPKKLKSANSSPSAHAKNVKDRSRSLSKQPNKSKSGLDLGLDDTYLRFEESYKNLTDRENGSAHYLNYRRADCDFYDDFFIPSISGTLPSSNNLLSLEARRARDIDECLRQRRQKKQLNVVKDQLVGKFRADSSSAGRGESPGNPVLTGGAALFNEIKRLREQQAIGKENRSKDANGSLSLLNSMRRCASFAERVKSFESKLGTSGQESTATSPRTPVDSVKNLPPFSILQELFVNNSTLNKENDARKVKMPVMKLSKDDWNVKCWEKRLSAYKQKTSNDYRGSTKSLNKAVSVDSYRPLAKPEKQVEVFKDRIKEMAEKLKKTRDRNEKLHDPADKWSTEDSLYLRSNSNSQGRVSHLRKELIKGVETKPQSVYKQGLSKPIKKLFEDDDDNDDGIDVNKHYDHLCINRPTNKYLPKNGYTSHLVRTKYNSATSKVINRAPSTASKQAYLQQQANKLTSRGSSASSTLSDYSTNTGGSSSGAGKASSDLKCIRCRNTVSSVDKISTGGFTLHRHCLTCASCGITLRTNEIQHYLNQLKGSSEQSPVDQACDFVCAICKPSMRTDLHREAADRLAQSDSLKTNSDDLGRQAQNRLKSREEFLNERINYNELYKSILDDNMKNNAAATSKIEQLGSHSKEPPSSRAEARRRSQSSQYEDAKSKQDCSSSQSDLESVSELSKVQATISPSPIEITLPLNLVSEQVQQGESDHSRDGYKIARSETIDGSEQVTLVLPSGCDGHSERRSSSREMMDEEELQRILFLDQANDAHKEGDAAGDQKDDYSSSSTSDEGDERKERADGGGAGNERNADLSDDPSSLNSPPNTEDYDESESPELEEAGQNETYDDFLTSEEFGTSSDREDCLSLADDEPGPRKVEPPSSG